MLQISLLSQFSPFENVRTIRGVTLWTITITVTITMTVLNGRKKEKEPYSIGMEHVSDAVVKPVHRMSTMYMDLDPVYMKYCVPNATQSTMATRK